MLSIIPLLEIWCHFLLVRVILVVEFIRPKQSQIDKRSIIKQDQLRKGYVQTNDIDYEETFVVVAQMTIIRALIAVASIHQ